MAGSGIFAHLCIQPNEGSSGTQPQWQGVPTSTDAQLSRQTRDGHLNPPPNPDHNSADTQPKTTLDASANRDGQDELNATQSNIEGAPSTHTAPSTNTSGPEILYITAPEVNKTSKASPVAEIMPGYKADTLDIRE